MAEDEKKKIDVTKLKLVDYSPAWIQQIDKKIIESTEFKTIIRFFVIETPCDDTSARGIPLTQYGWKQTPWKDHMYFESKLFEIGDFRENNNLFVCDKREGMKELFDTAMMSVPTEENIIMLMTSNTIIDLFKHIRNSIAHCRFQAYEKDSVIYYHFENGEKRLDVDKTKKFECKADIVVKQSTLLGWIDYIKHGGDNSVFDEVEQYIKDNTPQNKNEIMNALQIDKKALDYRIGILKDENKIEYKKGQWNVI